MPMDPVPSSPVIALQTRHSSVRGYTREPIPGPLLETLIGAGQHAASSSFIQAYSVIRVTRPEARSAIAAAAGDQAWIERAAEFLVFCADLRRVNAACLREGTGALEGWTEHGLAAVVDVALMAQNVLLAAESVGLGGVYIGGIRNDPATVADVLGLPELVAPVFGMCLGWPAENPEVKPRQPLGLVLHQDRYRDPGPEQTRAYDRTMADYYAGRGSNTRLSDWSATTAKAVQGKKREHLLGFLQAQGFFRR
jgi:nitroreductase